MFTNRRMLSCRPLTTPTVVLLLLLAIAPVLAITDREAISALEATQTGFRLVHAQVAPAVVSITSRLPVNTGAPDPFEFFFRSPRAPQYQNAAGSGVIIRPEGIVLTNSHVVQGATKVTVQLAGSTKTLPAEVIQTDPRTDLAVVRITEKGTYPTATLGNADTVKVGDWAIAIGSPFRLSSTMTVGVISATGRRLPNPEDDSTYGDLLQTDASINPGNSGGALVNIHGEVIGINFMIFSPGDRSGSVGIGFAIPLNEYTKRVITALIDKKPVEHARLGVALQDLTDAMREQFGVPEGGVFVDSVVPGQAAEKAGVKAEDVIVTYNGTKVTDGNQFISLVERTAPGVTVTLTVIREKKTITIPVVVGTANKTAQAEPDMRKAGLTVETLTAELAQRLNLDANKGVLVTRVEPESPAEDALLRRGDIIKRVAGMPVTTADEFWTALSKAAVLSSKGVLLRIQRGDAATTLTLVLPSDQKN